ncbi:MAG: serine/threonine-protein kinase [Candidatus Micrarchaeota archaeon]
MQRLSGGPGKDDGATKAENLKRKNGNQPEADPYIGAVMNGSRGRYSIMEVLGGGGMGKIYAALDESGSKVAVKIISPEFLQKSSDEKEKAIERFFREVRAVALIDHRNVIKIFDVGSYKETVFCTMECLKGGDLDGMAKRQRPVWEWLAPVMMDVCDGVKAAHDLGIMHRDLSPDNIFLAEMNGQRVVKVLDFGLAKFMTGEDDGLTKTGFAMGKLTFMAPEQAEKALGKRSEYDHRVDIYALGVIMYKLLTGVPPFKGENAAETLFMRLNVDPKRPREINPMIPPEAEEVIMNAMARNENVRYQSASELKAAIKSAMERIAANMRNIGKPESDDMNLGGLLYEIGRKGEQAPLLPAEVSGSDRIFEAKKKSGSAFGKFIKWTLAIGALASAGYCGYAYRSDISHFFSDIRTKFVNVRPRPPHEDPKPAPSASSSQQEGYLINLDSVPSGASVFEIRAANREYLGMTPLSRRVSDGEHVFEIVKRNYTKRRVTVSATRPMSHVVLTRLQRPPSHSGSAQPEEAPAEETSPEQEPQ